MRHLPWFRRSTCRLGVCVLLGALMGPPPALAARQWRYLIAGRVEDPHGLRPANAMVTVGFDRDGVGYGIPLAVAADGSFVTHALSPGTYVLTVIRHPCSATERSMPVGLTIARIENADVTGVTVTIQPDMTLEGRIRLASGTPGPPCVVVTSCLAVDGVRRAGCLTAEGASDGRFILRNAFGPRLLQIAACDGRGPRYAEPRVLLDGRDVTREPTDFSTKTSSVLEIVLSRPSVSMP